MSSDAHFSTPTFSLIEPGEGQRWSTWPSITPSERGPQPFPAWLVFEAAAFDTELGIVKTGKEADVFLIERAVPGHPERSSILAAKRYRGPETSDFHRSSQYREGRRMRRHPRLARGRQRHLLWPRRVGRALGLRRIRGALHAV